MSILTHRTRGNSPGFMCFPSVPTVFRSNSLEPKHHASVDLEDENGGSTTSAMLFQQNEVFFAWLQSEVWLEQGALQFTLFHDETWWVSRGFSSQVIIYAWLVVWNHGILWFSHHIGNGKIIPTDFHSIIYQTGRSTTNQIIMLILWLLPRGRGNAPQKKRSYRDNRGKQS